MIESEPILEHGFYRTENHTIMSGRVVRWRDEPPSATRRHGLEVSASRDGVMVQGYSLHILNVENLKAVLDLAQREYEGMRRKGGGWWPM